MVGATVFETATPCSQSRCSTRLSYAPTRLKAHLLEGFAGRGNGAERFGISTTQPSRKGGPTGQQGAPRQAWKRPAPKSPSANRGSRPAPKPGRRTHPTLHAAAPSASQPTRPRPPPRPPPRRMRATCRTELLPSADTGMIRNACNSCGPRVFKGLEESGKTKKMTDSVPYAALVVEDDPIVRLDLAETLRTSGFEVFEAGNAKDAIKLLEAHPAIRVVFTDIEMPGTMDGLALAHYVRHRWPPTIIVVSSGQIRPLPELLPSEASFMSKPYHYEELGRLCRGIGDRLKA